VVTRNTRLEQLQRDGAIVTVGGARAPVKVSATLDAAIEYDLVLVTVLASQVDAVLPSLTASRARTVMFMFNTFEPLTRLREAVGAARFAFGFPSIVANIVDGGQLTSSIVTRGALSPVTDAKWGKVFTDAGIPCSVQADMESWLRTHAAVVVPVMTVGVVAHARKAGVTWTEAGQFARAMHEGFELVRRLGHPLTPSAMAVLSRAPTFLVTTLLWLASRSSLFRKMGAVGPREPRALIDEMSAVAPGQTTALLAIRP
jgi:2-dehydropantoate 2-reductase